MNEAHMTGYQMQNVSTFLENLNTLNKDSYLYDMTIRLTGPVCNADGDVLGQVEFNDDEDAYVFVPGGSYEVYPQDA